jgi:nitroimidazol reductase NimA-like FMN-containing flavoprotein (pyridoxamine 5'-phosphate oxidase superfamily)
MAAEKKKANRTKNRIPKASRPYMPGYGLPKGKEGLLSWTWAEQRLKRSHNYWISTTRPDGRPHMMVIWSLWRDGAFYFSSGAESRKARNLAKNPYCVVGTEEADEAVVVEGEVSLLPQDSKSSIFKPYENKYKYDMSAFTAEPVFVVKPTLVFGLPEKKYLKSATRWEFDTK